MEQSYQFASAGMNEAYENYLFDYLYIEQLKYFGTDALIEDCRYLSLQNVTLLGKFHRLASVRFTRYPSQLAGELWGRMAASGNTRFDKLLQQAIEIKTQRKEIWLRPKFACFDRPDGEMIRTYQSDEKINGMALSPDNKRIITIINSCQLAIWDVESGKLLRNIPVSAEMPLFHILFAPDGTSFAVIWGAQEGIKIWNTSNYEFQCDLKTELYHYYEDREGASYRLNGKCAAYTNDSKAIIVKTADDKIGKIKLLNPVTGEVISSIIETSEVYSYGIGGKSLIAMGCLHPDRNNSEWARPWFKRKLSPVLLFDYDKETQELIPRNYVLEGHDDSVRLIAVSPDDTMVATSQYGKVKLWDANTAILLGELQTDHQGIGTLTFLEGGKN
ncbi:MAG: hypothetical protein LBU22_04295 [Dysgonamonadaceae bacterium]|jgi:hypothetical protein|nr:hypothetical protein [Dysgonamonadaceae bacterium]